MSATRIWGKEAKALNKKTCSCSRDRKHARWLANGGWASEVYGLVGVRTSLQVQIEARGGRKQGSDLFIFCKIAPAAMRRMDLRGQEG